MYLVVKDDKAVIRNSTNRRACIWQRRCSPFAFESSVIYYSSSITRMFILDGIEVVHRYHD